jgi:ABC-type lipoprotein release transport system permease subunit
MNAAASGLRALPETIAMGYDTTGMNGLAMETTRTLAAAVLASVALLATLIPMRRATLVDPAIAMRAD